MQFSTLAVAIAFSTGVTSLPVSTRAIRDDPSSSTQASAGAAASLRAVAAPVTLMAITSSTSIDKDTKTVESNDNLPAEDSASADLSDDDFGDMSSSGAAGSTIVGPFPTGPSGSAPVAFSGPSSGASTDPSGSAPSGSSMDGPDVPAQGLPAGSMSSNPPFDQPRLTGFSGLQFAQPMGPSDFPSGGSPIQFHPQPPSPSSGFSPQPGPSHISAFPFPPPGHPAAPLSLFSAPLAPVGYPHSFATPPQADACLPPFVHSPYPAGFAPFYPAGGFAYPPPFGPSA